MSEILTLVPLGIQSVFLTHSTHRNYCSNTPKSIFTLNLQANSIYARAGTQMDPLNSFPPHRGPGIP